MPSVCAWLHALAARGERESFPKHAALVMHYMDLSKLLHTRICESCYVDLSMFYFALHLQQVGRASPARQAAMVMCYMDLSKLLHGFVKVVTWICLSFSMYFLPFPKKNQAEE